MKLHFWRIAARIAWRDLRNSRLRCLFLVAAIAVSLGGVGAVHSAAKIARNALELDSRAWLAGDLCIDMREPIGASQIEALDALGPRGIRWTVMTTTLTMASSDQAADSGLIQVKAVDPQAYPYYGAIGLIPRSSLQAALKPDSVVVSEEVLDRLEVRPGNSITLGGHPYRIAATIRTEPDRFANEVGVGMRCILSREGYTRSGIEQSGNPVKNRVLLRLASDEDLEFARRRLQEIFPAGNLRDYRAAHREETRISETVLSFLSVTAFLALILGAIGVAFAVRQHAENSLPGIAIMKVLGGQSGQIGALFLFQIACLMIAGIAAGVPLGLAARFSILAIVEKYLALPQIRAWEAWSILAGTGAACCAMMPVLIEPALWIRNLRPAVVLRRSMWSDGREKAEHRHAVARSPLMWISAAASSAGFAILSVWMLRSAGAALWLLIALVVIGCGAELLTFGVLRLPLAAILRSRAALAGHGIACLSRPGNRSRILIAALAAALTVTLASFEAHTAVLRAIFSFLPYDHNSLYLVGFRSFAGHNIEAFLRMLPEVEEVQILSQIRVRPHSRLEGAVQSRPARPVPGAVPPNQDGSCNADYVLDLDGGQERCIPPAEAARLAGGRTPGIRGDVLFASGGTNIRTADAWNFYASKVIGHQLATDLFPAGHRLQPMTVDYYLDRLAAVTPTIGSLLAACDSVHSQSSGPARVVIPQELAAQLDAHVGSRLEFDLSDRVIETVVTDIAEMPPAEALWSSMKLDCSGLEQQSLYYQAAVRLRPGGLPSVRRAILDQYPNIALISAEEINLTINALTRDASVLIRAVAWFALAAGMFVLIAIVAASAAPRTVEIGILSALGARRKTIVFLYTIEFAAIGALAGIIAAVLSCGFTSAVLAVVLHRAEAVLDWKTLAAAITASMAAAVVAGWLPTWRLLDRKPMDVLRSEQS